MRQCDCMSDRGLQIPAGHCPGKGCVSSTAFLRLGEWVGAGHHSAVAPVVQALACEPMGQPVGAVYDVPPPQNRPVNLSFLTNRDELGAGCGEGAGEVWLNGLHGPGTAGGHDQPSNRRSGHQQPRPNRAPVRTLVE